MPYPRAYCDGLGRSNASIQSTLAGIRGCSARNGYGQLAFARIPWFGYRLVFPVLLQRATDGRDSFHSPWSALYHVPQESVASAYFTEYGTPENATPGGLR
jgi:hypothetical protein